MMHECRMRQSLQVGEDVGSVLVCGDPDRYEGALFDVMTNEMIAQIDMLCADMVCGFFGESDGTRVVGE
jgi:hypothetical protein